MMGGDAMDCASTALQETTIEQQVKDENKETSDWLLFYEERKREFIQSHNNILLLGLTGPVRATSGEHGISDPTGRKVTFLERLDRTEKWLHLVEEIERRLSPKMRIFLRLRREYRYRRGRYGWVAPVQHKYAEAVAQLEGKAVEDVWIEDRHTFQKWWQRIVEYTAREAAKRGLFNG